MWNINKEQLKYFSFYYFSIVFLIACTALDFYMETVSGFTFGYLAALVYMWLRLGEVKELLKGLEDE